MTSPLTQSAAGAVVGGEAHLSQRATALAEHGREEGRSPRSYYAQLFDRDMRNDRFRSMVSHMSDVMVAADTSGRFTAAQRNQIAAVILRAWDESDDRVALALEEAGLRLDGMMSSPARQVAAIKSRCEQKHRELFGRSSATEAVGKGLAHRIIGHFRRLLRARADKAKVKREAALASDLIATYLGAMTARSVDVATAARAELGALSAEVVFTVAKNLALDAACRAFLPKPATPPAGAGLDYDKVYEWLMKLVDEAQAATAASGLGRHSAEAED